MVYCLLHWVSCWSSHICAALDETVSVSPSLVDKLRGSTAPARLHCAVAKRRSRTSSQEMQYPVGMGGPSLPKSQKSDELPIIIFLTFEREVKRKPWFFAKQAQFAC
jgi:hypothetical protein